MEKDLLSQKHNWIIFDEYDRQGPVSLGPYSSYTWRHDPKHLLFTLARYKFCAKMLLGKKSVLEIGCGDAIGAPILLQSVDSFYGIDLEEEIIKSDISRHKSSDKLIFKQLDIIKGSIDSRFDSAVSLDVIEHIPFNHEVDYFKNICRSLSPDSICIIGTPNITTSPYASKNSADGHVNLKSHETLSKSLSGFFSNVLMFSMNDEVVHTGFSPMAHYLIGVGIGLKQRT